MRLIATASSVLVIAAIACSGGAGDQAGQPCKTATECYPGVDTTKLKGAVQCLDKVPGGYCTHLCTTDADCCAVSGECKTSYPQVCAPFESTGMMMCFLSCEQTAITASQTGVTDPTIYCQKYADQAFGCRSTGGGAKNRKICSL